MMLYDNNNINITMLEQYNKSFENEKKSFCNTNYDKFNSNYLTGCNDLFVKSMATNIKILYNKVSDGYKKISEWWDKYISDTKSMENYLSKNMKENTVSESVIRNFLDSKLSDLPGYNSNLDIVNTDTKIAPLIKETINNMSASTGANIVKEDNIMASPADSKLKVTNKLKKAGATIVTGAVSVGEGALTLGENLFKPLRVGADKLVSFLFYKGGKITDADVASGKREIMRDVKETFWKDEFDSFYDNNSVGKSLKQNSYFHDTTRNIGNTVGNVFTAVAGGGFNPAAMAALGGLDSFGEGTTAAWNENANYSEGLKAGAIRGAYNGATWLVGGKVASLNLFEKTAANVATRVGIDTALGAADGLVDPYIKSTYRDGYYDENNNFVKYSSNDDSLDRYKTTFESEGGVKNVALNAGLAGIMSAVGEAGELNRFVKSNGAKSGAETNVDVNLKNGSYNGSESNLNISQSKSSKQVNEFKDTISVDKATLKNNTDDIIENASKNLGNYKNASENLEDIPIGAKTGTESSDKVQSYFKNKTSNISNNNNTTNSLIDLRRKLEKELEEIVPTTWLKSKEYEMIEDALKQTAEKHNFPYSKNMVESVIKKFDQGIYNGVTSSNGLRAMVKNMYEPHRLAKQQANIIYDNLKKCEEEINRLVSEKLSLIKNTFENMNKFEGYYGIDQGIAKKHIKIDTVNQKKIGDPEYFRIKEKLHNKYGMTYSDASKLITGFDNEGACSYAAFGNEIAAYYLNKPQMFEKDFGYPLYTKVDGQEVFNSLELMTDLYMYMNDKANGGKLLAKDEFGRFYLTNDAISSEVDIFGRNILDASDQVYLANSRDGQNNTVISNFLKSKNENFSYDSSIVMRNSGNSSSSKLSKQSIREIAENEVLKGRTLQLDTFAVNNNIMHFYDLKSSEIYIQSDKGHAIFVTDITDDGLMVSSWGRKFLVTYDDLSNGMFILSSTKISKGE